MCAEGSIPVTLCAGFVDLAYFFYDLINKKIGFSMKVFTAQPVSSAGLSINPADMRCF